MKFVFDYLSNVAAYLRFWERAFALSFETPYSYRSPVSMSLFVVTPPKLPAPAPVEPKAKEMPGYAPVTTKIHRKPRLKKTT
jgi:hypothetical protein